jgi:N utilization substance protein B
MKTARRYARQLAMQGIFQWQFNPTASIVEIEGDLRQTEDFPKADEALFSIILEGVLTHKDFLLAKLLPYYQSHENQVRPIEKAILLIGAYELAFCPKTASAIILDEAIEIAKAFGGTDGHKFVNSVLDKLASNIRTVANNNDSE